MSRLAGERVGLSATTQSMNALHRALPLATEVEPMPRLFEKWLSQAFKSPIPRESKAHCADCPMCGAEAAERFNPSTKCCTYVPDLPNFLVGAILSDHAIDSLA